jgi:peptidoglycan/xylan/chitin deacetylase (PgdA/CDA1 family)
MPKVRAMWRTPLALAYWLGAASSRELADGDDIVFLCHGTPRFLASRLEQQLRYLRRVLRLVPLAEIAASAAERRPADCRRRAAIIFDDGLRSNVSVAYPILRSLGIPATFFVCPGLIEERKWIWTHEVRARLRWAAPRLGSEIAARPDAPGDINAFVQWMKKLPLPERARIEAQVRQATPSFVPTEAERDAFDLAGWQELRALDPAIVTIGSHSLTHPILPDLSDAAIEVELRESRRLLEAKLDRPADLFSYPNNDLDWRTLACVRRHYRAAVAHGSGIPRDPHLLPSVHLPQGVLRLAWQVNHPAAISAGSPRRFIGAGTPA